MRRVSKPLIFEGIINTQILNYSVAFSNSLFKYKIIVMNTHSEIRKLDKSSPFCRSNEVIAIHIPLVYEQIY